MPCIRMPGPRHEALVWIPLMAHSTVKRRGPGRPQGRPKRRIGEQASSRRAIRQYLRRPGIRLTMPRTRGEHRTGLCDRRLYRQRHTLERLRNRLQQCRRMATREEKQAAHDRAMLSLATSTRW
jgi:transposase